MKAILTINGVDYDGPGRAAAGILGIDDLTVSIDEPWRLDFHALFCGPTPTFLLGQSVGLRTTADDGTGSTVRFTGDIARCQPRLGARGWEWAYSCEGLKARGNRFPFTAPDGTGTYRCNLAADDLDSIILAVGQTVGQVVTAALTGQLVAQRLFAAGIGGYATNGDGTLHLPPTLPAQTVADLALLDIVPRSPVRLSGPACLDAIEQFILEWHPKDAFWVDAAGTIRVTPIFGQTQRSLVLPGDTGAFDNADRLAYDLDASSCYTAVEIVGEDIDVWYGSHQYGTLVPAWTLAQQNAWTLDAFIAPRQGSYGGSITSLTSTSATVTCDDPTAAWAANYLQTVGATISVIWTAGSLLSVSQTRTIISCTALSPGGSATVTWDAALPIDSTAYDKFRIESRDTGLSLVGRTFNVRDPGTGALGAATYVGSHMVSRFPRAMMWSIANSLIPITMPAAKVQWSPDRSSSPPYYELPISRVELDRTHGRVILSEPAVLKSASPDQLRLGYPTNYLGGLYHDVFAAVPYNKGTLVARAPTTGYAGVASASPYNVQRTLSIPVDTFVSAGDKPDLVKLANEHLILHQDPRISGSVEFHGWPGETALTPFDPLALPYALALTISGTSPGDFPLQGLDLPVRSVTVAWPEDGPDILGVSIAFSNNHRALQGNDLYIHPARLSSSMGGAGQQNGSVFADQSQSGPDTSAINMGATRGHDASPDLSRVDTGDGGDFDPSSVMEGWRPGRAPKTAPDSTADANDKLTQKNKDDREGKAAKFARETQAKRNNDWDTETQAEPRGAHREASEQTQRNKDRREGKARRKSPDVFDGKGGTSAFVDKGFGGFDDDGGDDTMEGGG